MSALIGEKVRCLNPIRFTDIEGKVLRLVSTTGNRFNVRVETVHPQGLLEMPYLDVELLFLTAVQDLFEIGERTLLLFAQRSGMSMRDMQDTICFMPYAVDNVAPGYFALLGCTGVVGFQIESVEVSER